MNEKKDSQEYPEKDHEIGDVVAAREALSPEEDRRILRKIDLKSVHSMSNAIHCVEALTSAASCLSWACRTCSNSSINLRWVTQLSWDCSKTSR